jgi:CubicO group peptidase (beta-lactamase class C family)
MGVCGVGFAGMVWQPSPTASVVTSRDFSFVAPSEVGLSAERLKRLDDGLQAMVDDGKLAGVVTLLARHGKIAFVDVAGVQDIESQRPMSRDSIFRIYSMTKPIVGVAMMMLYEEGKWRLNDPVSQFIPEFAALRVYEGDNPDGSMKLVDSNRSMTMRELMTHTAGLSYSLDLRHPVNRLFQDLPVRDPMKPLRVMIDRLSTLPLLAQPGTRYIYSSAVDVQGYLVELLSGQPLGEFLDERIFVPLGMTDTAFFVPPSERDRHALRHTTNDDGKLVINSRGEPFSETPPGPSGGGGLFGTADDYLRFTQMLLNGGEFQGTRLLAPRTVQMMRTNHMSAEATAQMHQTRPGMGFGMDFMVYMDPAAAGEPHMPGAYYWLGIDGTWFWIDPELDLAFVGMIQHQGAAQREVHGLSRNWVYQAIVH